jgi:hypothetical protein
VFIVYNAAGLGVFRPCASVTAQVGSAFNNDNSETALFNALYEQGLLFCLERERLWLLYMLNAAAYVSAQLSVDIRYT